MARKPVNPIQLEILRWIADGCPSGVMTNTSYKTTAVALRNRGLAKVSKRGGWHAEITRDGQHYLEKGSYPGQFAKPKASRQAREAGQSHEGTPHSAGLPAALETRGTVGGSVKLEDAPAPVPKTAGPGKVDVPVPAQLRNLHPVIAALRDDRTRFALTPLVRNRALRILQGLVMAAEREGYSVREVRSTRSGYGYSRPDSKDHLVIETGETSVEVRVFQQNDRSAHEPTARELAEQKRWGSSPTKYDYTPNDLLRIELHNSWDGRRHAWRDGKRGLVETKLSSVLGEVAYRHAQARERRMEAEREMIERERKRQVAIEQAKVLLLESHRAQVLSQQAADWRYAAEVREYACAVQEAANELADLDEKRAASEWASWACAHADVIDPLRQQLRIPDDPEPTPDALRPFLRW